jgi:hypothetical protein
VRRLRAVALLALLATVLGSCAEAGTAMPRCRAGQRLGIVAQSVPTASYLPCIEVLPAGWRTDAFDVDEDGTRFELRSDRADRAVIVQLSSTCRRGGSTPIAPRAEGVRSYVRVDSISPRYTGRFFDVFAGGCVTADFSLGRGPHIALVDELRRIVGLYSRRQLSLELNDTLGITLDP